MIDVQIEGPSIPPSAGWRKRLGWITGILVAGLLAGTGVAFLQTNGVVSTSISGSTSATGEVYTGTIGTSLTSLTGAPTKWAISGTTATAAPSWSPTQSATGSVTGAGDLGIIDAASGSVLTTVALTNAGGLSSDYSYLNLPVEVYKWDATTTTWAVDSNYPVQYLGLTNGYVTFTLPVGSTGGFYEIVVPTGGSYYVVSTSSTAQATLSPSFDITATPIG